MYLKNQLTLLVGILGSGVTALTDDCLSSTFRTSFAFTATINLGQVSNASLTTPITIPGGIIVAEPISGGTVSGPLLNATVLGGLATPRIYLNGSVQQPIIDLYGTTQSGLPFSVHEEGTGSPTAQVTRISLNIGGGSKFDSLRYGFILASVNPTSDRKKVEVKAFLVENVLEAKAH